MDSDDVNALIAAFFGNCALEILAVHAELIAAREPESDSHPLARGKGGGIDKSKLPEALRREQLRPVFYSLGDVLAALIDARIHHSRGGDAHPAADCQLAGAANLDPVYLLGQAGEQKRVRLYRVAK